MLRYAVLTAVAVPVLWSCAPAGVPERNPGSMAGSYQPDAENAGGTGGAGAGTAREHACAAARHGSIAGRPIEEIDTASLPMPLRVYTAGSPITMDYWPERMNIVVGADGRVSVVKCG